MTALTNGNYVVRSPDWNNGAATEAGAVTWGSGTTGVSGVVSAANSLVGSTVNDLVGSTSGVTALTNGNYVVSSPAGTTARPPMRARRRGATARRASKGVVSAANSLVGSIGERPGRQYPGVTALTQRQLRGEQPGLEQRRGHRSGAATWGSGTTGVEGSRQRRQQPRRQHGGRPWSATPA